MLAHTVGQIKAESTTGIHHKACTCGIDRVALGPAQKSAR